MRWNTNFLSLTNILTLGLFSFVSLFFLTCEPQLALAFDCSKATTQTELAICSDGNLKTLDEKMELAYFELQDNLPKSGNALLRQSQRMWLKFRDANCEDDIDCLSRETELQLGAIRNTPIEMVPLFIWQAGDTYHYQININGYQFASARIPGHRLFNRELANLIKDVALGEKTEKQEIGTWEREMFMTVSRFNSRMISVSIGNYDFSGGAHPNSWSNSININLETARNLETAELFPASSISQLENSCTAQIVEAKYSERNASDTDKLNLLEEEYPGVVAKHISDMRNWDFDDDGALVNFDSYAIGAYAEGAYECKFSNEIIHRLSAGNPLLMP